MRFDPPLRVGSLEIDSSEAAERMLLEHPAMLTRPHWAHAKKVLEEWHSARRPSARRLPRPCRLSGARARRLRSCVTLTIELEHDVVVAEYPFGRV